MKLGYLGTIRWEPFPSDVELSLVTANQAVVRAFLYTGIPRPPRSMSVLDEARFFLHCASEIEHGLLIQYLYALYSLDFDASEEVGQWAESLREIAREEMGHLLTVQNLLIAIGDTPYFDRQYLATDPFPFQLEPLSRKSLAKYVTTESPGAENVPDPATKKRVQAIEGIASQAAQNPEPIPVYDTSVEPLTIKHVGGLYAWLYWLFLPTNKIEGPWKDLPKQPFPRDRHLRNQEFVNLESEENPTKQAVADKFDWGFAGSEKGPIFIRTIKSDQPANPDGALQTIYDIAVQGEGFEDTANSHFKRFLKIFNAAEKLSQKGIRYSRRLATSPSVHPDRPGRTITHPVALLWATLFNVRYEMLLLKLSRAMSLPRATVEEDPDLAGRQQLIRQAVDEEMLQVLRPIADRLTHLPLKARQNSETDEDRNDSVLAGPTFELPEEPLPTQPPDVKQRLLDLFDQTTELCKKLGAETRYNRHD